jgi:hypothetical protein
MSGDFGVDRLSVAFPLADWSHDPEVWGGGITRRPGPGGSTSWNASVALGRSVDQNAKKLGGGELPSIFVGVMERPGMPLPWGKIEYNPARVVDPDGVTLCPPEDVRATLREAVTTALQLVKPSVPLSDMRVRRLDVARDFQEVQSPSFYVRGLLNVRRPWARYSAVYNDPGKGGAESLRVGSGAGLVRLYDKNEESPEKAKAGHLRWEAECRRGWAERYGDVTTVADLTTDNVRHLAIDRWDWSSMGVEVAATDRVIDKILRAGHRADCLKGCADHLSPAEQRGFYGYLVFTARGWPTRVSKSTGAKYGRIARELCITLSVDAPEAADESACVGRLDWVSGREVLLVA